MKTKVLITGNGQLAWELQRTVPPTIECLPLPRAQLDITDAEAVERCFASIQPDAVINAAAYTAVDTAEQAREQAYAVNCDGVAHLAHACQRAGAYLLHISTDFVFDGEAHRPYGVDHPLSPLGVYGHSKAAGEAALAAAMTQHWAVIRTAWVYSSHGHNFVKTMLRLMREKPALRVVADQVGTPTWAHSLAEVCWSALAARIEGLYHWTDAGVASWYDFAVAIERLGVSLGLLEHSLPIHPIASEEYPTPAQRPAFSVLDKRALLRALPEINVCHWQQQLAAMMAEFADDLPSH